VFDIRLIDGARVVVRVASEQSRPDLAGGIYWSNMLRPLGIPLPRLLYADADGRPFAYMILERLPGTDLAHVYSALSKDRKCEIARQLAAMQTKVGRLPQGHGYGFVHSYEGPWSHRAWRDVLISQLSRSGQRLASANVIDPVHAERVEAVLFRYEAELANVPPTPFLEDITSKNVIIDEGCITGIVDVDELCFGDPLFVLGLTRMALLAGDLDTDYIDCWKDALGGLSSRRGKMLDLYTAIHCVNFLSEIGQSFNRAATATMDPAYIERLLHVLDAILKETS
jgi:aminoglycoside phosphotransferase (APT) family kinase protein